MPCAGLESFRTEHLKDPLSLALGISFLKTCHDEGSTLIASYTEFPLNQASPTPWTPPKL